MVGGVERVGWKEGVGARRGLKWRGHSGPTGGSGAASWYTYVRMSCIITFVSTL